MESLYIRPDTEGKIKLKQDWLDNPEQVALNPEAVPTVKREIEILKEQLEWEKKNGIV